MTITLPNKGSPKFEEVTDEMVIQWLREAEIEERRTHVLYEDVYGDPENVLHYEHAMILKRN